MEAFKDARAAAAFDAAKMKKVNLFDTERMFCDVYGLQPGQQQAPHRHAASDKVYFVLDGTGTFDVADERRSVGPGTAVLAPAGAEHAVRNDTAEPLTLLVFMAPKP